MNEPEHPPLAPNIPEIVPGDLACLKCGYNLRGLRAAGPCPECAEPITTTYRADILSFASADDLIRLRRAIMSLMLAMIMAPAVAAVANIVGAILSQQERNDAVILPGVCAIVISMAFARFPLMRFAAAARIGHPSPAFLKHVRSVRPAAWASFLGLALLPAATAGALFDSSDRIALYQLAGLGGLVISGVLTAIASRLILSTAERIPTRRLYRRAVALRAILLVGYGLPVLMICAGFLPGVSLLILALLAAHALHIHILRVLRSHLGKVKTFPHATPQPISASALRP